MTPRIGSVCTGYGGLDEAVQEVVGGTVAWHCQYEPPDKNGREDKNQYAAKILAHHWPRIPNHGDITAVDWTTVEPVDVLTMGFPCQDVSVAGLRAGLLTGNRSGLWRHCARAIAELQPNLVVIENVPGLLSSPADGDVEPCPWCLGGGGRRTCSAGTRSRSRRPGQPRVRCGMDKSGRSRRRRLPQAAASLHPRLACPRPGPATGSTAARTACTKPCRCFRPRQRRGTGTTSPRPPEPQ